MSGFRIGTTSYIKPADILPNVRYLAGRIQDVELVLFEVDDGGNNLPSAQVVEELVSIARGHDLSFTVHLPLDLQMGAQGAARHRSLEKAQAVIERTRPLRPWAYVLHLDGAGIDEYLSWVDQAVQSLDQTAAWAGAPELLAVENLEGYPLDTLDPVLEQVEASRCVDVGHLWLDGHDPLPFLRRHLDRTRVIHLHGIGSRDHQSLAHVEPGELRRVFNMLDQEQYGGVVTLEVFGEQDFNESMAVLERMQQS